MAGDLELAGLILDAVPGTMRVIRRYLRESAKGELTIPQLRVLAHVSRGTAFAVDLAELQGVSKAAMSKMVDALVCRGLLNRAYQEGNRKQIFLKVTEKGKALYTRARNAAQARLSEHISQASSKQKSEMERGLRAIQEVFHGAF